MAFESLIVSYEDSQSDTKNALNAFNKLAASQIDVVYVWGATASEVISPVAQTLKIPTIVMSISPTVAKDRKYVIRTVDLSSSLVAPLVQYLRNQNYKKVTLLKTEWSYTEELTKALKAQVADDIIFSEYSVGREEKDFKTLIIKMGKTEADILGIFLGSSQISAFYQQQKQLKQNYPTFGSSFFASQKEILNSGSNIEGAVFSDYSYCDYFVNKYVGKFGTSDHLAYAVNTYDIANIISKVAHSISTTEDSIFFNELRKEQNYDGVCGNFSYKYSKDIGGYFEYPTALYQIKAGKVIKIGG